MEVSKGDKKVGIWPYAATFLSGALGYYVINQSFVPESLELNADTYISKTMRERHFGKDYREEDLEEIRERYRYRPEKEELADDIVKTGVARGNRNSACFELARKHRWLLDKGHITHGAAKAIILEFAKNCEPPLQPSEALRTLESALSHTRGDKDERGNDILC